MKTSVSGVL